MTKHAERPHDPTVARCGAKGGVDGPEIADDPAEVDCWRCITVTCGRPLPAEPELPEHDKLTAAKRRGDATQTVGDFLEWLGEQGLVLAKDEKTRFTCEHCGAVPAEEVFFVDWSSLDQAMWRHKRKHCKKDGGFEHRGGGAVDHVPEGLYMATESRSKLLAKFFDIDEARLESEKRALLDMQRAINAAVDWAQTEGRKIMAAIT